MVFGVAQLVLPLRDTADFRAWHACSAIFLLTLTSSTQKWC